MITLLRISSIVLLLGITLRAQADEPALESIFNGKDLEGWNLDEDNPWFSAEDGGCLVLGALCLVPCALFVDTTLLSCAVGGGDESTCTGRYAAGATLIAKLNFPPEKLKP